MSTLRLLIVGLSWPPETFLARLIRGLAAADVQVTLALSKRPEREWDAFPNVEFLHAPVWEGAIPSRLFQTGRLLAGAAVRSPRAAVGLRYKARGGRIAQLQRWLPYAGRAWDIIYFPWNGAAIDHLPLFDIAPVVISCRGAQVNIAPHNPQRTAWRDGLRETFRRAAAVHCVSAAILAEAEQYGLERSKAHIIRPAVDPAYFQPIAVRRNDFQPLAAAPPYRLITTGSLIWRKGYEYLLSAVRLLLDRGVPVQLDVIGDGAERQRVAFTIDDLELNNCVTLRGRLAPEQVLRRLQQADVFVLPSLSEGISNAVLEGMACGLPVVTTNSGGMAEAVDDGVEGFVVPTRDPQAMAEALWTLWQRPELRAQMGAAARARILRDFTLDQQVSAFVRLFQQIAEPGRLVEESTWAIAHHHE